MQLKVTKRISDKFKSYCDANGIDDLEQFMLRCMENGLNILMYGSSPMDALRREENGIKDYEKPKRGRKKQSEDNAEVKQEVVVPSKRKITIVKKG